MWGRRNGYGDRSLRTTLVESLAEELGQVSDDAVVCKEEIVFGEQFAAGFVFVETGLEFGDADDAGNALAEGRRKSG